MEGTPGYHVKNKVVMIEQEMTTALSPSLLTPTCRTNDSHKRSSS